MKKLFFIFLIFAFGANNLFSQTVVQKRAETLKLGMNLSYLDNWWLGTKEKNFSDFVKPEDAAKREKMFAAIAENGFQTVRIPINFGAWASFEKPYKWQNEEDLKQADNFVRWALENNLNAIIDLHHVEFDGSVKGAADTDRVVWLWKEIAGRYKNTNAEKIFLKLETSRTTSRRKCGGRKPKRLSKPFAQSRRIIP